MAVKPKKKQADKSSRVDDRTEANGAIRKQSRGPDRFGLDDARPATSTAGRRHRPSTRRPEVVTREEQQTSARGATGTARSKRGLRARAGLRREDKREDPNEMETSARPKNRAGDPGDKKRKGKATHALEAQPPSKRPSRKSTRRGANHIKPDSQQRRRKTRAVRSPEARHAMAGG
jgi:hypothetical protein